MLHSMLRIDDDSKWKPLYIEGHDENSYPTESTDVVPECPKPKDSLSELIVLLQQANE